MEAKNIPVIRWLLAKWYAYLARRARARLQIRIGRPPSPETQDRTLRLNKDLQSRAGARE